jgi:hypothetical protein
VVGVRDVESNAVERPVHGRHPVREDVALSTFGMGGSRPAAARPTRITQIGRWWSCIAGAPMRAFARCLSRRLPHDTYDGIDLFLSNPKFSDQAERFFANTRKALESASTRAPRSYSRFRKDVKAVVLMEDGPADPYHRFQLAILVPQGVALGDVPTYAAWLLHASRLSQCNDVPC